jgi:hypothetical protein
MSTKDFVAQLIGLICMAQKELPYQTATSFQDKAEDLVGRFLKEFPSPHSEDFLDVHDHFMLAAVQGQMAYQGLEGCGSDEGCKDVAVWADEMATACMKRREARKGSKP